MTRVFITLGFFVHSLCLATIVVDTKTARFSEREIAEIHNHVKKHLRKLQKAEKLSKRGIEDFKSYEKTVALEYENLLRAKTYRATVDTKFNVLTDEPALTRLQIPINSLLEISPAEKMLSAYAQEWAYKQSSKNGPNCWHTSMASIFLGWSKHRYMGPSEYSCHLKTHFTPIEKPEKWGDMIAFDSSSNSPIHGFTYLGPDRLDPEKIIVFTKNGYAQSKYLFMTLADVKSIYSPRYVRYYRPNKDTVIDPAEDSKAPCANAMRADKRTNRENADPMLNYILSSLDK